MKQSRGMKWVSLAVALSSIAAVLMLSGCGGGGGGGASATITGLVQNAAAAPMLGVTVSAGTATGTTGADGKYMLRVVPGTVVVRAQSAGFVDVIDVATVVGLQTANVNFTMSAVGASNPLVAMSTTVTVANDGNAVVTFPAGSVLDAAGTPVVTANVDVTMAMPTDANYSESFPGLFIGTQPGGVDTPIESFGFVTVDVTSGGQQCTLDPLIGADIDIPVDPAADPGTPTIELWSLNETTGKWVYEGLATRVAGPPLVYRAHVTHFSTYNLDRPIAEGTALTVTVKDGDSNVSGASVVVVSTSGSGSVWEGRGVTGADGTYRFPVIPQGGNIQVTVNYGDLTGRGSSYDVTGNEVTMTVTLIRLVDKVITFVRLVDTVETPVAGAAVDAFAEGQGGGVPFNGTTAADGTVTIQLPSGAMFYMVNAHITIGADNWYGGAQANSLAELPSRITMTQGGEPDMLRRR